MEYDDIDEDDIWNYKTRSEKRKLGHPSKKTTAQKVSSLECGLSSVEELDGDVILLDHKSPDSKKSTVITGNASNQKKKRSVTKSQRKNNSVNKKRISERPKYEGFCPNCQMPFQLLVLQSPNWHYSECILQPKKPKEECSNGLECKSIIESHYRKYLHSLLAESREVKSTSKQLQFDEANSNHSSTSDNTQLTDVSGAKWKRPLSNSNDEDIRPAKRQNSSTAQIPLHSHTDCSIDCLDLVLQSTITGSPDIFDGPSVNDIGFSSTTQPVKDIDITMTNIETSDDHNQLQQSQTPHKHTRKHTKIKTPSKPDLNSSSLNNNTPSKSGVKRTPGKRTPKKHASGDKQTSLLSFFKMSSTVSAAAQGVTPAPLFNKPSIRKTNPAKAVLVDQESCGSSNDMMYQESKTSLNQKNCPFYKRIPGTKFVVDAFRYGIIRDCSVYFLTHFHYDHYAGLKKSFNRPIYCTKVTGNLVRAKIKVSSKHINELPLNETIDIEGTKVTALEANHCPGAVLLLFSLKDGRRFLHTGDFRAHPSMEQYPSLQGIRINQLYLDTTYCDPIYAFPPQDEMIKLAVSIVESAVLENNRTLFVCGTYTIGKERLFIAIADALKTRAFVMRDKKLILDCLEDSHIRDISSLTPDNARVHVLQMNKLNFKDLQSHLSKYSSEYDCLVAFEPTGWTHRKSTTPGFKPKLSRENVKVYGIPYSEHSSYSEMKRFVQFIKPDKIIPTVNNGKAESRRRMVEIFNSWMSEEIS
ncbi:DNA cross-link repair 1A protein-like isoform X2 [Tubulanus polymorphus]|uniref:DNA cross-link repair 1A protein-like isoform X2 n=1 Tax=Tubulanus polymorphus TaxID=672921 RepID=UPI003DA2434E